MKHWYKLTFEKVFFCVLLLLLALNFFSAFVKDDLLMNSSIALFIPVFLVFFFLKHSYISFPFISFLIFSFLGDISYYFFPQESLLNVSSILYILSYTQLLIIILPKFKVLEVDKIIGVYLLVVITINLYFLYTIYEILKTIIPEQTEVLLIAVKSFTLIILGFTSFAVYLNTQTKQSILFLVISICFGFSAVINYVGYYYLYDWSFVMLDRATYILGLYFLFKHLINENKERMPVEVNENEKFSSNNILA